MISARSRTASLILIGAGPGDPELITVKGLKALSQADVVLYDALAAPELLDHTRPDCKKVFVGKRKGKKAFSQEEINQLIVFYASRYGCVARLKGGDPNVFGRGHEEIEYVFKRGITDITVIPGISSSIAAPTAAGIPVTKRGVNESFWVITGTLSSGELSNDMKLAAQSSATLIVLMGMSHLDEILNLIQTHRSMLEPMAVIQHATTKHQKIVRGNAATLRNKVMQKEISSPAVIVIGKVVDESYLFEQIEMQKELQYAESRKVGRPEVGRRAG